MNTTPTRAADKEYRACSCKHEYFDSIFGAGIRPHNPTRKKRTPNVQVHRCVVCSKEV